jgi:hypothetical protein
MQVRPASLLVLLAVGCVPDLGDGVVACGTMDPECPPHYYCGDMRCWRGPGGGGGGNDDGGSMPGDSSVDNDAFVPETCTMADQRICPSATKSAICAADLTPKPDRTCPPTSSCLNGYCQVPSNARSCSKPSDCQGSGVCTPFSVVSNGVRGVQNHCAPAMPGQMKGDSAMCATPGADANCSSGYCVSETGKTGNVCFVPCKTPGNTGCQSACAAVTATTVEGTPLTGQQSCGP